MLVGYSVVMIGGETTDFAWYDNGSQLNPNAVIDNLNGEYEESKWKLNIQ